MTDELMSFTGFLIRRAQQAHVALWQQEVSTTLSGPQFGVLSVLHGSPGSSQAQVCQELDLDRSTVADLVLRLEGRGFIARTRHAIDKRRNVLELTDDGRREYLQLLPRVETLDRVLTRHLSADDRARLRALLSDLLDRDDPREEPR